MAAVDRGDRGWRSPEGLPLAYEVLPGNTADRTTLRSFLDHIERQYGKARRVWGEIHEPVHFGTIGKEPDDIASIVDRANPSLKAAAIYNEPGEGG